jgi:large subunit ribosomal protein L6
MSRVGKKIIPLPKGVKITMGKELLVEGPKGTLSVPMPQGIEARQVDGTLEFLRDSDQRAALHGLTRALAAAAVQGVSTGFTRELDITGTGYRADVKGKIATFTLGYSHPIELLLPDGVDLKIDKQTHLVLSGYDKQMVGQVAANIRALRPPDPYKNKGVRYTGEALRKKAARPREQERSKWRNLLRMTFGPGFTRASGSNSRAARSGRVWRCSAA